MIVKTGGKNKKLDKYHKVQPTAGEPVSVFFKTQNIVQTMHQTMLIAHPYLQQVSQCQGPEESGVLKQNIFSPIVISFDRNIFCFSTKYISEIFVLRQNIFSAICHLIWSEYILIFDIWYLEYIFVIWYLKLNIFTAIVIWFDWNIFCFSTTSFY